ncbi:nicotinamide-nucleotide amidase [Micrococcales bacterium KH10]|nr:nicotinamide-nucleotide amidase [Micrococcales bacterium KH10]
MNAEKLAKTLVDLCAAQSRVLCVAESLTGGALADALVRVPGTSAVFHGGVVAYATPMKAKILGVNAHLLQERGAVDPEVAREMSRGALRLFEADIAIATTGVAGPKPQDGHPVGQVFVAVAGRFPDGRVLTRVAELSLEGDRGQIRALSVCNALQLAIEFVSSD